MARGLSGSSQYLSRADQTELRPAFPLAVSCWFKGSAQGNFKYIVSKLLLAGEHPSYGFASDSGGDLRFYIGYGTSAGNATASPFVASASVFDNTWRHLLGTYDGANVRLYVNGTEAGSGTAETRAVAYANLPLYVGSFDGTQLYATGSVAELALLNAIPTTEERAALASAYSPIVVKPSAVVGYWPLIGRYSPEIDIRQGLNLTVTSATTADHTRVYQGTRSLWVPPPTGGGTTLNADASLTATATITASATVDRAASSSRTTTATVTPAAAVDRAAAASSTTTATVTPTAALSLSTSAAVSETAAVTATAAVARAAAVATTTTVTVTATADISGQVNADTSVVVTATRTPTAAVDRPSAAAVTVTAAITAAAAVDRAASAALTATATVTPTALRAAAVDAAVVALVTLTPTAAMSLAAAASLTATATITAESADDVLNATSVPSVAANRTATSTVGASRTSSSTVSDG